MKKWILLVGLLLFSSCAHGLKDLSEFDKGFYEGIAQCQFNQEKWHNPGFRAFCNENPKRAECAR